jgi:hypothetical protein
VPGLIGIKGGYSSGNLVRIGAQIFGIDDTLVVNNKGLNAG